MKTTVNLKIKRTIILFACFCALSLLCVGGALRFNPNPDAYWLVATGRWIARNRALPKTNPWCALPGLGVVVQQPLVALFNYAGAELWGRGPNDLWVLAVVFNVVALFFVAHCSRVASGDRDRGWEGAALALVLFEMFASASGLTTTRPYMFSVSFFCATLSSLYNARRGGSAISLCAKSVLVGAAVVAVSSAASAPVAIVGASFFLGALIERDWGTAGKTLAAGVCFALGGAVCSFAAGQGFSNFLYLARSANAMKLVGAQISEMAPAKPFSACFILACAGGVFSVASLRKERFWAVLLLLCSASTFVAQRNAWMVVVAIVLASTRGHISKTKVLCVAALGACVGATLLASGAKSQTPYKVFYAGLEDCVREAATRGPVFSDFNSGAYLEYAGVPCALDARPELFSKEMGGTDLLERWFDANYGEQNGAKFVEELGFSQALVYTDSKIARDLAASGWRRTGGNRFFSMFVLDRP